MVINGDGNTTFTGTVTGGNGSFTNLTINAGEKLRFDGAGGHTFIQEVSNDNLIFATGGTERMKIESDGTVRVKTGSVLVETVGQGIYLGGTASSHKLNYYSSGTWTPTVTSSAGGGFPAYSSIGYYQRVGKVVTASFEFTISNLGTASGTVIINNLPISIASGNGVKTVVGYGSIAVLGQSLSIYHYTALNQIGINKYDGSFAGTTSTTRGTVTYWAVL